MLRTTNAVIIATHKNAIRRPNSDQRSLMRKVSILDRESDDLSSIVPKIVVLKILKWCPDDGLASSTCCARSIDIADQDASRDR